MLVRSNTVCVSSGVGNLELIRSNTVCVWSGVGNLELSFVSYSCSCWIQVNMQQGSH